MKIHQLQKSKWLKDKARRKGRWNATGTGNYSGKGLKGQKSRSWHSMKAFFEGWKTSIVQRLPKARWFTRYYKLVKKVVIVNLGALDADPRITDAMEITKQLLKDLWYIKTANVFVKLLSHGDYAKHLSFKDIDAFSAGAKQKMEHPGTVHSLSRKAPAKIVKDKKSKVGKLKIKTVVEKKTIKNDIQKEEVKKEIKKTKIDTAKVETPVKVAIVKKITTTKKPVVKKETIAVKKPTIAVKKPTTKKATTKKTK